MAGDPLAEIIEISNSHLAETGGGHNQKGIEFQKSWALVQMFALEENEEPDFLFLFEAIQDVAILDSPTAPTAIELHQVKKRDRGEWSWATLTKLHEPADATKPRKRKTKPLVDVNESPIGKLHAAVCAFKLIKSSGRFVSNAGCNLTLADGSNSATSLPSALSLLPAHFRDLLTSALMTQLAPVAAGTGSHFEDPECVEGQLAAHLNRAHWPYRRKPFFFPETEQTFAQRRRSKH